MDVLTSLALIVVWTAVVIAVALLLLPSRLEAYGQITDEPEFDGIMIVDWAWGVIKVHRLPGRRIRVFILGLTVHQGVLAESSEKGSKVASGRKSGGLTVMTRHRTTVLNIIEDFVAAIELQLSLQGSLGLGSPQITAYLDPILRELLPRLPLLDVDLRPNYINAEVDIVASASAFVWPPKLFLMLFTLLAKAQTRQLIVELSQREESRDEAYQRFA